MSSEFSDISIKIDAVIKNIRKNIFSTKDVIDDFSYSYPVEWNSIVSKYGRGGKGAGQHYSSYSYISQQLNKKYNRGEIKKLHYERSPDGYGSPVIRYWSINVVIGASSEFPDEAFSQLFVEGVRKEVWVNTYERDRRARDRCTQIHGFSCKVCDRDFQSMYGDRGRDFIHIHHLMPLSLANGSRQVNPDTDLVPVCPNCHAMIHRGEKMLSIEEARALWLRHNRASKKRTA